MTAMKDEGGCPELSPYDIMALDADSTEFISGIFVPALRSIAQYLVTTLEREPALAPLTAKPFVQWSFRDLRSVISLEKDVLKIMDAVAPEVLTDELADVAFEKFGITAIPHWLQREDHWFSHIKEFGIPQAGEIAEHLYTEDFWLKAIELAPSGAVSVSRIPHDEQTEAILEKLLDKPGIQMEFIDINDDLLTPSTVGRILGVARSVGDVDEALLREGIRWRLDNLPEQSLFDKYQIAKEDRTAEKMFYIHALTADRVSCPDHYQAHVELERMRPEELVSCITTEEHVTLFKQLFGTETAIRLLGDRSALHKRQWVSEDLGL